MKNFFAVLCVCFIGGGFFASAHADDSARALRMGRAKSHILIFGKTIREAHRQIIPLAGAGLVKYLERYGYEAVFSQNTSDLQDLEKWKSLVLLDVTEGILSLEDKENIRKYFENGGGIVAIHGTISAGKDWPWFKNLVGTEFAGHAAMQLGSVQMIDSNFKAKTAECGKQKRVSNDKPKIASRWTQLDEWYNFSSKLESSEQIWATADESTFEGGNMGTCHPIAWSKEVGKGRFWYTALGHSAELYEDATNNFTKLILQAVNWTSQRRD